MKRLFTGGRVVSGSAVTVADVLVDGEKIVSVAPQIDAPDAEKVDVTGKLLLPGFEAIKATVKEKMELFGSVNKA